mmetsp:Transcript_43353/g.41774  ORF Transcript_43353/g.41774 Transcript_43353/m.41774 type:complete len:117 (+) Transcript_43353:1662-2012(+)
MQIFVYGDSIQAYLLAVIFPNKEAADAWAAARGMEKPSFKEILDHPEYKKLVLEEIANKAKEFKLTGLERVRKVHFIDYPFTVENDLLTPTFKVKRNKAKIVFQKEIDEMYKDPLE